MKLGEGGPVRLTTAPQWDFSPAWSPAGDQIAFLRSDSATLSGTYADILVVSPGAGPERKIGRVKTIGVDLAQKKRGLVWTPDGKSLIVCGTTSDDPEGLLLVSVDEGTIRRITLPSKGQFDLEPALSPDGHLLAFRREVSYTVAELFIVPLGPDYGPTGPERPAEAHPHVGIGSPQWQSAGKIIYIADNTLMQLTLDPLGVAVNQPRPLMKSLTDCAPLGISYAVARPGAVLCSCERDDTNIWRLELASTADKQNRLSKTIAGAGVSLSPDGKEIVIEIAGPTGNNLWLANSCTPAARCGN